MRKLNKHAAEMTIGTLVIIVLAIIVLVVVALGFGTGWSNLWQKISSYFGGGVNVDSVKSACAYACTTQAKYDYCSVDRKVIYNDGGSKKEDTGTCVALKNRHSSFGIEDCPDISCVASCKGTAISCNAILTDAKILATDKRTACEAQVVVKDSLNDDKCKWTNAAGNTAAKCELPAGYDVKACSGFAYETTCKVQKNCDWI